MADLRITKQRETAIIEAVSVLGQRWIENNMELGIFSNQVVVQSEHLEELIKLFKEHDLEVDEG